MSGQTAELLKKISETEQLELAFDIWEKYAGQRIAAELTSNQKAELERRLKAHHENPMLGRSWEHLKQDLGQ
ncbi:MAG: addiction module protein [Spirochaetota bacterium]